MTDPKEVTDENSKDKTGKQDETPKHNNSPESKTEGTESATAASSASMPKIDTDETSNEEKVDTTKKRKLSNDDNSTEEKTNETALTKENEKDSSAGGNQTKRKKVDNTEETSPNNASVPSSFSSFQNAKNTNPFAAALAKANQKAVSSFGKADSKDTSSTPSTTSTAATNTSKGSSFFGAGSTFGSGFGSTSNNKSTFGNSNSSTIFGSSSSTSSTIFGSSSGTSAFGSKTPFSTSATSNTAGSSSLLWGSSVGGSSATNSSKPSILTSSIPSSQSPSNKIKPLLASPNESVRNGEENEESILQCRCKLYTLVSKKSLEDSKKDEESEAKKQQQPKNWREVGIGPLRILRTKKIDTSTSNDSNDGDIKTNTNQSTFRIVQRRECTPGGPGTKVILNMVIGGTIPCTISRQADKYVQLATVCMGAADDEKGDVESKDNDDEQNDAKEEKKELSAKDQKGGLVGNVEANKGDSVMYLFKVKTIEEGDTLQKQLETCNGSNNGKEKGDSK